MKRARPHDSDGDPDSDPNSGLRWIGPAVQFICGAIIGTFAGIGIFAEWLDSGTWSWLWIPATALICGTLAAIFGDRFWHAWLGRYDD